MFEKNDELEEMLPENLPVFKKGQEIYEVVKEITDLIPEDNDILQDIKGQMLSDAAMLTVKVARAEGGDLYDNECKMLQSFVKQLMI